jgi:hypothetical protein
MKILAGAASAAVLLAALAGCSDSNGPIDTKPAAQETAQSTDQATDQPTDGPTDGPTDAATDQPSNGPTAQSDGKWPDPCKLISKEDAAKVLGEPTAEGAFLKGDAAEPNKGGACEFDAAADNGNNIRISVGSLQMFGAGIGDPVPGVGD